MIYINSLRSQGLTSASVLFNSFQPSPVSKVCESPLHSPLCSLSTIVRHLHPTFLSPSQQLCTDATLASSKYLGP